MRCGTWIVRALTSSIYRLAESDTAPPKRLEIVPVLNKIDLPGVDVDETTATAS